jgi:hypothetical protein
VVAWLEGVVEGKVVAPEWVNAGVEFVVHTQPPTIKATLSIAQSVASPAWRIMGRDGEEEVGGVCFMEFLILPVVYLWSGNNVRGFYITLSFLIITF